MKEICRFCDIVSGKICGEENKIILENNDFFTIASVGALVEGWILVSPKMHLVSMKELYRNKQFTNFLNNMLARLQSLYKGQIIAFEHGPNKCGSNTACGTNHAHLHLVPYSKSLLDDMLKTGLRWERCKVSEISQYVANNEYLFYTEIKNSEQWNDPEGYIHILEEPISQYFRRIIANQLDCEKEFDYKKYPRLEVTIKTGQVLK